MEWHKAKNIMLVLLVLVNLILLGSRAYIAGNERQEQLEAVQGAAAYLKTLGIELDVSLIPQETLHRNLCVIPRDREAEADFANALLSDVTLQSSSSTDRYLGSEGLIIWRHGGQLEVQATLQSGEYLLEQLGGTAIYKGITFTQTIDGLPLFNCTLTILDTDMLQGRWCFGEPAVLEEGTEMSVPGLLIAYGAAVAAAPPEKITQLLHGYIVQSVPNVGVRLVPVLRITADETNVYLNALTGETMIVE